MKRVITLSLAFLVPFIFSFFISSSLTLPSTVNAANTDTRDVNVNLDDVLSISINPSTLAFNITPTPSGVFMKKSSSITISTNNVTGYTLTLSDADNDTNLLTTNPGGSSSSTTPIPSISTASTNLDDIDTNKWGYAAGSNTTFNPIPTLSSPTTINSTTTPSTDNYNLTIGTKVDTTLPAGTYTDKLVLSAIANYVPPPITTLADITNMQDMTSDVCTDSAVGDTATLTDTRDGNTYNVRKMEDNKCWMTQNLRLGTEALPSAATASSDITLTSADSNVSSNFTIPTSAIQTSGNTDWGPYDNETAVNTVHVYNNGNSWIAPTSEGNDSTVNTTGTPPNQSQYIGNYYNWYTATAGTGTYSMSTDGQNATSSICPKGWKLPTGGANSDITGLTNTLIGVTDYGDSTKSFTMQSAPNYFVLSGSYLSGVRSYGSDGYWWSSTAYSSSNAYYLYLNTSLVFSRDYIIKCNGFSVRCVAQ